MKKNIFPFSANLISSSYFLYGNFHGSPYIWISHIYNNSWRFSGDLFCPVLLYVYCLQHFLIGYLLVAKYFPFNLTASRCGVFPLDLTTISWLTIASKYWWINLWDRMIWISYVVGMISQKPNSGENKLPLYCCQFEHSKENFLPPLDRTSIENVNAQVLVKLVYTWHKSIVLEDHVQLLVFIVVTYFPYIFIINTMHGWDDLNLVHHQV